MNNAGFDPTFWSHWALIGCFFGLAATGLTMAWQWRRDRMERQRRSRLARRLAMELAATASSPYAFFPHEAKRARVERNRTNREPDRQNWQLRHQPLNKKWL